MKTEKTTKQKLKCSKCGYSFYLKSETQEIPFRCPYCSKEGTISPVKHILEEL